MRNVEFGREKSFKFILLLHPGTRERASRRAPKRIALFRIRPFRDTKRLLRRAEDRKKERANASMKAAAAFESGIPRYARRSRGIRTLFLVQVHPCAEWTVCPRLTRGSSFSGPYTRWLAGAPIFRPASRGDRHRSGRRSRRRGGYVADVLSLARFRTARETSFPPPSVDDDFAMIRDLRRTRPTILGASDDRWSHARF